MVHDYLIYWVADPVFEPVNAPAAQDDVWYPISHAVPSAYDQHVVQTAYNMDTSAWSYNQVYRLPQPDQTSTSFVDQSNYGGDSLAGLSEGRYYQAARANSVEWQGYHQQSSTASTFGAVSDVYGQGCAYDRSQVNDSIAVPAVAQDLASSLLPPATAAAGPSTCTDTGPVQSTASAGPAPYSQTGRQQRKETAQTSGRLPYRSRILEWSIPVARRSKSRHVEEVTPYSYSDLAVSDNTAKPTYVSGELRFLHEAHNDYRNPSIPGLSSRSVAPSRRQMPIWDSDVDAAPNSLNGEVFLANPMEWYQQAYWDELDQGVQRDKDMWMAWHAAVAPTHSAIACPTETPEQPAPQIAFPPAAGKARPIPLGISRHLSVASPAETYVSRDFSCEPSVHNHTAFSSACTTPADTAESSAQAQSRWIEVPPTIQATRKRKRPAREAAPVVSFTSSRARKRPRGVIETATCRISGCQNGFISTDIKGVKQHLRDSHGENYGPNGDDLKICQWEGCRGQDGQGESMKRTHLPWHILDHVMEERS